MKSPQLKTTGNWLVPAERFAIVMAFLASLQMAAVGAQGAETSDGASAKTVHWAFSPLFGSTGREMPEPGEAENVIDSYFESERSKLGISDPSVAGKRHLIRRLTLDLTGLPPTWSEVTGFLADEDPEAYAGLVEQRLRQPAFGECWGRHWLDVARYADSNGCSIESNNTYDDAWRYRDWVIDSFNSDKPYDEFVREQVAGDLLPSVSTMQRCEQLIATTFLQLGPKALGTGSSDKLRMDIVDEQIDSVGKAFLGLSLGCARCHDHKLEPVSSEDYYGLAGIFSSTLSLVHKPGWRSGRTWHQVPLPVLEQSAATALKQLHEQQLAQAKSGELKTAAEAAVKSAEEELQKLKAAQPAEAAKIDEANRALAAARLRLKNAPKMAKVLPQINPLPAAMAVVDRNQPVDEAIRVGGEHHQKGDVVPRSIPVLFCEQAHANFAIPDDQSGRLQLANWLVDCDDGIGSLAARVIVNRVWQHLMHEPLVPTSDNFGLSGSPPIHPELIDRLARFLVERDWSIKSLVRQIVLSRTYRRAAIRMDEAHRMEVEHNLDLDPANRWLWHYKPHRQSWESLRDSILTVTGKLNPERGGKTLQHQGLITIGSDMIELETPSPYDRRSVYLPVVRDAVGIDRQMDDDFDMRTAFDFACPNLVSGNRDQSLVPAQPLFLMNSRFVIEQSDVLAATLLECKDLESPQRITRLFQLTLLRDPDSQELEQATSLLTQLGDDPRAGWAGLCQALLTCNEFLFVE